MTQKQVTLIAGGSSVKEGLSKDLWDKIKGTEVWSLNFCYKFMPFLPKRQVWCDRKFFTDNCKELQVLFQQGVDLYCKNNSLYNLYKEVNVIDTEKDRNKFDPSFKKIFIGTLGLTGLFAISLALKENYDKIYLLGFDFGTKDNSKNTHWYQELRTNEGYVPVISSGVGNPSVYADLKKGTVKPSVCDFNVYKPWYDRIFNVSSNSNIHQFKMISYDEYFKLIGENNDRK